MNVGRGLRLLFWSSALASMAVGGLFAEKRPRRDRPAGVEVVRNLTFREDGSHRLTLDLYLPRVAENVRRPIVVAVHGGSWAGGSKSEYAPQFGPLLARGVAVAVVDYRLARPGAPSWPGAMEDLRAALDYLIAHAAAYRLDPERTAAVGTSSGGLLALRLGQSDARIHAVVALSVPADLSSLIRDRGLSHEPARMFLGEGPGLEERAREASPLAHVRAGLPPILLIHGDDDGWVPIGQAREMHGRLIEVGAPSRLIVISGARHGFELMVGHPEPRDLSIDVFAFLEGAWAR